MPCVRLDFVNTGYALLLGLNCCGLSGNKKETTMATKAHSVLADSVLDKVLRELLNKREMLLQLQSHLEAESLRELAGQSSDEQSPLRLHPDDASSNSDEQEVDLKLVEKVIASVKMIDRALRKIKAGEFGKCEGCEEAIDSRRLVAVPAAQYCLRCQEDREAEHAIQKRPHEIDQPQNIFNEIKVNPLARSKYEER